jgi:nuclear pore complex protein Nup188
MSSSWKTAFSAILRADKSETEDVSTIEQFLSHPDVLELLSHPFNAFCPPSQERKAAFETKTSAINVTPSSSARYDIKEIKDDALWLSKEAAIDEVSALRVVVVECQSRTCAQLVDRFSSEELAGIQDAAGRNQSVLPVDLLSLGDDAKTVQAAFDTKNSRQLRILRTYLCERRSLLDCVKTLLQGFLYQRSDGYGSRQGKEPEQLSSRLVKIGEGLARVTARESEAFLLECIASIDANIRRINEGSGWYKEEGSREDVEIEWINNQISEITITMEIIFQSLDTSNFIASSRLVLAWVHMVTENGFFEAFTSV